MSCHFTLVRMAIIRQDGAQHVQGSMAIDNGYYQKDNRQCWLGYKKREHLGSDVGNVNSIPVWRTI